MRWFTRLARPGPVLRTYLRLEPLDDRAVPTTFADYGTGTLLVPVDMGMSPPLSAPVITGFTAEQVSSGWYRFTGQVTFPGGSGGTSASGLTVTFGGVPSLDGQTVTTGADGTFSLFVAVRTDGSDQGTVTARTTANGLASNVVMCNINPS